MAIKKSSDMLTTLDTSRIKAVKCMKFPAADIQLNPVGWTPTLLLHVHRLPITHDVLPAKELNKVDVWRTGY